MRNLPCPKKIGALHCRGRALHSRGPDPQNAVCLRARIFRVRGNAALPVSVQVCNPQPSAWLPSVGISESPKPAVLSRAHPSIWRALGAPVRFRFWRSRRRSAKLVPNLCQGCPGASPRKRTLHRGHRRHRLSLLQFPKSAAVSFCSGFLFFLFLFFSRKGEILGCWAKT